ncbi:PREDICTED: U1 small nuclear ribonucleoprotein C-like [Amphimedon queenslandica]|uniref:U1 small nuclear ribonucleoprotein C n=1 Tax=Amphimedon queenslandica TaxID=400682 RepID=A0A1X7VFJ4_AMPQE|nr:PREDICTED: U1 small nuclear ribonucleoprotein C-like [Amphimedon queenslandica]|eukprot:XP_003384507.1 PREDICTED: U1 small nuclear ribonucleoprotein C-like [Amphimedon queenslandica]
MGKYYCDYCDTYLTHDSPSVRKTHNSGRRHKENVRLYYVNWLESQAQSFRMSLIRPMGPGLLAPPGMIPVPPGMAPPGIMMPPPIGLPPPPRPGMVPAMPPRLPGPPPPGFPQVPPPGIPPTSVPPSIPPVANVTTPQ